MIHTKDQGHIILGAGGHARVVLAALRDLGCLVRGCIAPDQPDARWPADVPWLGGDAALKDYDPKSVILLNGIGSIATTDLRQKIYRSANDLGFSFASFVHPTAFVSAGVSLGQGVQIHAGAIVQTGCLIGANVVINTGSRIDHDCQISDHCHIAPGAILSGNVTLKAGVHIGTGATIVQNTCIETQAIVGAGSVVLSNVARQQTVVGVPARTLPKTDRN